MESIQDYAIIGDGRSAALVSRKGSIDWLCWPRFDSPSIFAALLDDAGGRWSIAPTAPCRTERRYLPDSNVLETRFIGSQGTLVLTDLMAAATPARARDVLLADHEILRLAQCERGEMEVELIFEPRLNYGRRTARIKDGKKLGFRVNTGRGLLTLRTDMPIHLTDRGRIHSRFSLRAGQTHDFSLTFDSEWPTVLAPLGHRTRDTIRDTAALWQRWTAGLHYDGPARSAVLRSALALKLLVYAPSGAVIAAPTTSLPERIGGDLNWDYRFCWLRDASMTVRALYGLGCVEEAEAFLSWLLHSTRLTRPELRILYDVYGNLPEPERVLDHLRGYRASRPVRVGNAAAEQLQLDVYGEVIDAAAQFAVRGGKLDRETQAMLCDFGRYVCRNWQTPDEGIWEPRSGRAHNTHSRLLCWTALDRLLTLHAEGHLKSAMQSELQRNHDAVRREIETRAWNEKLQSYVAQLDGDRLDASLLLLAWYGFEKASSERMKKTFERVTQQLGARGLLYRYRTGEEPAEGAFGICSFWGAEFLALGGGSLRQAQDRFQRLLGYANDVGLFAEELDPRCKDALGNFPQAFTHVGLINAALSLTARRRHETMATPKVRAANQSTL